MIALVTRERRRRREENIHRQHEKGMIHGNEARPAPQQHQENEQSAMSSNNHKSRNLRISKGVKQGCPLSPTLFNICIESLLKVLNQHKEDGYHWNGISTCVQAYADDVVLFADTEIGMKNLISIVEEFCLYAGNMQINPKKCNSYSYLIDNNN